MPVQQGMNFGGASSGDDKRKRGDNKPTQAPEKKAKETRKPVVKDTGKTVVKKVAKTEAPKHEKPAKKSVREPDKNKPRRKDVVADKKTEKLEETNDLRSAKEILASREFAEASAPKSRKGLIIGLAIAAVVLAIAATVFVVMKVSQRSIIDEPIVDPTYENADHQDGSNANDATVVSSDVDISGYIDTGDGFSYQYPSFAEGESVELVGKIRNDTDKDVASVGINFFLYDNKGVLIGTAADGTDVVKAGAEWEFHAKCATDVKRADVARFLIDQLQFGELDVTADIADKGAGMTNAESAATDAAKAEEANKATKAESDEAKLNGSNAGANAVDPTKSDNTASNETTPANNE